MAPRQQLHDRLREIADHVYFQPPSNVTMVYPCIVYERDAADTKFADDEPYRYTQRYSVTVIDRDPDSVILDEVKALPKCTFNRAFQANDLNHDVFNLFF